MYDQALKLVRIIIKAIDTVQRCLLPEDFKKIVDKLDCDQKIISDFLINVSLEKASSDLRPIPLVVSNPANDKATVAKAKKLFPGGVENFDLEDLEKYGLLKEDKPNKKVIVRVGELINDTPFELIFGNVLLDDKALSFSEVMLFCENNKNQLSQQGGTFFLVKSNNFFNFFVIQVIACSVGLRACFRRDHFSGFCCAKDHYYVVTRQT